MSFAINGRNLPSIATYADCERLFNNRLKELTTRRMNGGTWSQECLPLVSWRDPDKHIEKHDDGYALYYHHTPIVTYCKDGSVEFNVCVDSASTHIFFERVAPAGWEIRRARGGRFFVKRNGDSTEAWHVVPDDGRQYINCDGSVRRPIPFSYEKELANMPARKEIRTKLKPFVEWYHAMTRVGQSMAGVLLPMETIDAVVLSGGFSHEMAERHVQGLMKDGCDEEGWRAAVSWQLVSRCGGAWWVQMKHEQRVSFHFEASVLETIFEILFRKFDGYRIETVTVPAGERP